MALYEDGKIRFDNKFIESFEDDLVRDFLRIVRYKLVDSPRSEYCTVEHLLYNQSASELQQQLYWYMLGRLNATCKGFEKHEVHALRNCVTLETRLHEIEKQMAKENDW